MRLAEDASAIRSRLAIQATDDWSPQMNLGSKGYRQLAYEAGNVVSRRYSLQSLPSESDLRRDLDTSMKIYQHAIDVKRGLLQSSPGVITSASVLRTTADSSNDPLAGFKPMSGRDYRASLVGRRFVRSLRHERLVTDFTQWAVRGGFIPRVEHPLDLILRKGDEEWLIEASVLYRGNANEAVVTVLGRLLVYRYFLYRPESPPHMAALFSESIGDAFGELLENVGVASIWKHEGGWAGSQTAIAAQIAQI
jgi:hypothetical protein